MEQDPRERTDHRHAPNDGPALDRAAGRAPIVPVGPPPDDAVEAVERVLRRHHRFRWLRIPALIAAIALGAFALARNPLRDPQRVVDLYAPGVTLGARVSASAQERFQLGVARVDPPPLTHELLGGNQPLFVGPPRLTTDGLGALALAVGPLPASRLKPTPLNAPVSRVALSIPSPDVARRVEQRLRKLLGRPQTRCYDDEGVHVMYWPGNYHGGALLVRPAGPDPAAYAEPFAARVVLGVRSGQARYKRETACARE